MGLFDKFRNKEKDNNEKSYNYVQRETLPYEIKYSTTNNGLLQVDFQDNNPEFKQFYDSTRLIIKPYCVNLDNTLVSNCMVSWYGKNDAEYLDGSGREYGRKTDYRGILAEIDYELLQTDPNYVEAVMKGLLNKTRVEEYLTRGMQDSPELPCGKYIGGIKKEENKYTKFFDCKAGRASHNSQLMVNRRNEKRMEEQQSRQQQIKDKETEIRKLQSELENLK